MTKEELREYLHDVYVLEGQLHTYHDTRNVYMERIRQLEQRSIVSGYSEEQKKRWEGYSGYKEIVKEAEDSLKSCSRVNFTILSIVWGIYIICFIAGVLSGIHPYICLLGLFITIPITRFLNKTRAEVSAKTNKERDTKIQAYCMQLAQEESDGFIKENHPLMIQHLHDECDNHIIIPQQKAEALLKKLYDMNIIHPKYRELLPIAQMYEYLDTGRCSELEGPTGAYNLYESELRQNIIINQLERVIRNLQQLSKSMYYATSALWEHDRILSQVSQQLQSIASSNELIQYSTNSIAEYARIAQKHGVQVEVR